MTKIALIADTHLGIRGDSPVFHEYHRKSFRFFFDYIKTNKIKHIIHLGDLFDRRKYLNYQTSEVCRSEFLIPVQEKKIKTHIIAGNHDQYYTNTFVINSLDEIVSGRYSYINTYNTPQTIKIDGLDILLLPWINQANIEDSMNCISTTQAHIVIGHLELSGFEMFRGITSTHGADNKLYDKFDLVFSGHYHHKSSINNIHYIGAFAEYTWTDYNDPRGFTIFDTETRKFEFVRNPHSIFQMLSYDDVTNTDIMKHIDTIDYSKYRDTYVKVLCVNKSNPYAFDVMLDKLHSVGPVDISVIEDISTVTFTENDEKEEVDQTQDTPSILSKYVRGLTLPVDNEKMISYLHNIYIEAVMTENVE